MKVYTGPDARPVKAWIDGVPIEAEALNQVQRLASMPFVYRHVALMPDAHVGIGSTVGSVIATKGAIIPAAVGVDIGCGMTAVRLAFTAKDLPDSLGPMRSTIEAAVPVGRASHQSVPKSTWDELMAIDYPADAFHRHPKARPEREPALQLGTLGGGNHFIEVCLDEADHVWVMLHSGSRGLGNCIGRYFIELAKRDMKTYFISVPDVDLAYLPEGTEHFHDYEAAVLYAQEYAKLNRGLMLDAVIGAISSIVSIPPSHYIQAAVSCHHNYISHEHHFGENVWVTRKGAVRAREGDLGIIPGSMGTKSYIVRGKGNPESFHSCSHGAGRRMSRTKALAEITIDAHVAATAGVECRKDGGVLDESPAAYKDLDCVMAAQSDLVEIEHTLRAVLCVKG